MNSSESSIQWVCASWREKSGESGGSAIGESQVVLRNDAGHFAAGLNEADVALREAMLQQLQSDCR
jgi:hypothetical protein